MFLEKIETVLRVNSDSHQVKRLDSGPATAMVAGQPVPNRRPGLALLCFGFTRDRAEQSMMQAFSSEGRQVLNAASRPWAIAACWLRSRQAMAGT